MTNPADCTQSRTSALAPAPVTSYLNRPGGRIGYDVAGEGPLVVLVPGMGDLRASYRRLAPALRDVGYRVACADLRGHGDSDTTFASYGDEDTASNVIALITELGGFPAVVVGTPASAPRTSASTAARSWRPFAARATLHYPQSQQPDITAAAILRFLAALPAQLSRPGQREGTR